MNPSSIDPDLFERLVEALESNSSNTADVAHAVGSSDSTRDRIAELQLLKLLREHGADVAPEVAKALLDAAAGELSLAAVSARASADHAQAQLRAMAESKR